VLQPASQHVRMALPAPSSQPAQEAQAVSLPVRSPAAIVRAAEGCSAPRAKSHEHGQTDMGPLSLKGK